MNSNIRTIVYGILAIPIAFLGLPLYIYLPNFYVNEVGLNVAIVGIVLFLSRLVDMIADPFIGRISDIYLKAKYMILIGSILLLSSFYFLTHPTSNSFVWLFVFSTLTYIGYSFVTIAYLTLNAKLGQNYQDNTKLSFSREVFTILGVLIALLLPYIFNIADNSQKSLSLMFNTILFILPICLIIFVFYIKEKNNIEIKATMKESLKKFLNEYSKSKSLFSAFILNNLANAIPATLFLFYVELVLESKEYTGILLIIYFLTGVLALPIWIYLSKKASKSRLWIASILLACSVFIFVPFLSSGDYIEFAIISAISGMSLGADMALPTSIQSDIAQESKRKGNEVSGVLFGFWAMITKLSLALAVFITFSILELVGFDSKNPNELSLLTLALLYSILPVLLKLISVRFIFKFKESN